jgi:hypothetical protein
METLIGGLIGGIFRLVPELFKFFDAKNERAHELSMIEKNIEADKLKSQNNIAEVQAEGAVQLDKAGLDALTTALKGQSDMAVAAGGWAASLSATVRPILTFWWCMVMYTGAVIAQYVALTSVNGMPAVQAILQLWGPDEKAIVSGMINFYFLGRVLEKK